MTTIDAQASRREEIAAWEKKNNRKVFEIQYHYRELPPRPSLSPEDLRIKNMGKKVGLSSVVNLFRP